MGPSKVENEQKGAYKTQYDGNEAKKNLLRKCFKVPRAYETLSPGLAKLV